MNTTPKYPNARYNSRVFCNSFLETTTHFTCFSIVGLHMNYGIATGWSGEVRVLSWELQSHFWQHVGSITKPTAKRV